MTSFVFRFRQTRMLIIGGDQIRRVIPDLVSEERAEGVGNPCLGVSAAKIGWIQVSVTAQGSVA